MEAIVSMRLDPYHALVRAEETAGTLDRDKMRMVLTCHIRNGPPNRATISASPGVPAICHVTRPSRGLTLHRIARFGGIKTVLLRPFVRAS
jgi:hypothetical protein